MQQKRGKTAGGGGGGTRCRKGAKCRKLFLYLLCNGHKTHRKCTQNTAEGVPGRAAADVTNITTIRSEEGQRAHWGEVVTKWKQGGTVPELTREKLPDNVPQRDQPGRDQSAAPCMLPKDPEEIRGAQASRSDPETIRSTHTGKRSECVTITRHIKRGKKPEQKG